MKCPQCGFVGSDYVQTCKGCGKDLSEARAAVGLAPIERRHERPFTSILDEPVEPSLVDDAPPPAQTAPEAPAVDIEAPIPEEELPGLLAQTAPVDPSEIAPSNADATPTLDLALESLDEIPGRNGSASAGPKRMDEEVLDFGEPLDLDETARTRAPGAPVPGGSRDRPSPVGIPAPASDVDDGWDQLERDPWRTKDPRVLPKGGFWMRFAAQVVDGFVLNVVGTAIFAFVTGATGIQSVILDHLPAPGTDPTVVAQEMETALSPYAGVLAATFLVILLIDTLYRPIGHWRWGQTLGKKLLGLRVVGTDGGRISFVRACARDLALLVSFLPLGLGFLWIAWDSQKQAWHDKLTGTYVLKVEGT
jgi:uncharacterized RDD family membrane protein YckC